MQRVIKQSDSLQDSRRSGSVTLEFIVAFPIVFIASLAIAEFFFLSLTINGATTALYEGAREGAEAYPTAFPLDMPGADNDIADKIVSVMNQHLRIHNVEIADPANGFPDDPTKQNATVVIERGIDPPLTRPNGGALNQSGNPYAYSREGDPPAANEIVVTLAFEIVDSNDPDGYYGPVPDWLASFGFSLEGTTFEMTARASLE